MNLANSCSREEISWEDVDRTSIEYRVLMAYAQRRWSASDYVQLLQRETKGPEGSSLSNEDMKAARPAIKEKTQGLSSEGQEQPSQKRGKKKKEKKKKSKWERLLFPSCLKVQTSEEPRQTPSERNGDVLRLQGGVGSKPVHTQGVKDDLSITLVADRLVEIVENSRSAEGRGLKTFVRILSIEEDGPQTSKSIFEEDGKVQFRNRPVPVRFPLCLRRVPLQQTRLQRRRDAQQPGTLLRRSHIKEAEETDWPADNEEKIIETIVALLRKSGDELQKKMKKDEAFSQCVSNLMSYAFFRRVTDQFLEEAPVFSTMDSEVQIQSTKVAFAMEVAARLTAVDRHPMNIVLGFGTRYLKENFSPWIHSQGGWEKALGVPDQEEVE